MEIIIPFKKADFLTNGRHIVTGKLVIELQKDWETDFHTKFNPYYANTIEAHPIAMHRLNLFYEGGVKTNFSFGMDLIDGDIDLETNLAIENYSESQTVYAIGSQLHDDEDNPLFLVKNENLKENILLLRYLDDNDSDSTECEEPVNFYQISSRI
ncbi:MAG TPA: hypothetical protein DHV28_11305 [Ignavibacteriales bacterium]|nr:hypothetical protein [Ignavibacteriales bacterium]